MKALPKTVSKKRIAFSHNPTPTPVIEEQTEPTSPVVAEPIKVVKKAPKFTPRQIEQMSFLIKTEEDPVSEDGMI